MARYLAALLATLVVFASPAAVAGPSDAEAEQARELLQLSLEALQAPRIDTGQVDGADTITFRRLTSYAYIGDTATFTILEAETTVMNIHHNNKRFEVVRRSQISAPFAELADARIQYGGDVVLSCKPGRQCFAIVETESPSCPVGEEACLDALEKDPSSRAPTSKLISFGSAEDARNAKTALDILIAYGAANAPAESAEGETPAAFMSRLYQVLIDGEIFGDEDVELMSPRLAKIVRDSRDDPDVITLGLDWALAPGQDFEIDNLDITATSAGPAKAEIRARFRNFGEPQTVNVKLMRSGAEWKIDEVCYESGNCYSDMVSDG